MSGLLNTVRRTARLMVGMTDYDTYLRHMADHHPDAPVMDRIAFFRDRQQARYGGQGSSRCC